MKDRPEEGKESEETAGVWGEEEGGGEDVLNRVPPPAGMLRPAVKGWAEGPAITEREEEVIMRVTEERERKRE